MISTTLNRNSTELEKCMPLLKGQVYSCVDRDIKVSGERLLSKLQHHFIYSTVPTEYYYVRSFVVSGHVSAFA